MRGAFRHVRVRRAVMAAGGGAAPGLNRIDLRRKMEQNHAVDRKIIRLVRERKLLYARNTLSVGNYHSKALQMWKEIANEMQWTVADVKRKWSHIRNSYSRHLRNEMNGARTIKGRMVTKWYLANELEFLRDHMATELRTISTSLPSDTGVEEPSQNDKSVFPSNNTISWPFNSFVGHGLFDTSNSSQCNDDGNNSCDSKVDENSSYYTFFRGIHDEYMQLSGHGQRIFKQKCLITLHELLDDEEQQQSSEVVIEESTSDMDDAVIIKSECDEIADREQSVAVESILGVEIVTTFDENGVEQSSTREN